MQIVAKRTLVEFWTAQPSAEVPLRAWHTTVQSVTWSSPQDVKDQFGSTVDFVSDNRVIFDIGGNKYRLVTHISYTYKSVLIKFVGTHAEYDKIDARTV
ncbi:type II toxin-antitoxin system HigB family toxin [Chelatococcus sp.]|uniref:type II toxin-antitoxin system HigB family toxin n=1 Tax=Chelatococcus sp. TaxID=1953771 RepID=UPI001ECA4C1E|nr:type II toxin-antitoxin system HigB family toxin [Chelatococcus sp.]MBX3543225.1 type II toxin-antitoxin system HigB family toxin [Chelatococcus sp.]